MKFFNNLPDDDHVPYKFIKAEPHIKDAIRYIRPEDYMLCAAIGTGFPLAYLAWERHAPTIHPRYIPKLLMVQVPFYFSCGFIFALERTYSRFWGWRENAREVEMWANDPASKEVEEKKTWQDLEW